MKSGPFFDFIATVMSIGICSCRVVGALLTPDLPVRLVQDPVRQVDRVATMMPEQVVDPRARLAVHVEIRAAEEVGLDDHVMQMERAFLDALANLAVRAREPARVRHHARLFRPPSPRPASAASRSRVSAIGISTWTCLPFESASIVWSQC